MARSALLFAIGLHVLLVCSHSAYAQASARQSEKLLIGFASFRERPLHPEVYFYEHDGSTGGKIVGKINSVNKRSDHHPSLSSDGEFCAYAAEIEGKISAIQCWSRAREQAIALPIVNDTPNTQMAPSVSADGSLICFEAWNRSGGAGRWDIMLFDTGANKFLATPNLNTSTGDERKVSLSSDGRWIAFATNAGGGAGLTDIRLYDRETEQVVPTPNLNSAFRDTEPALSANGRLLAFISDRPNEDPSLAGTRDVYLYDLDAKRLVRTPGLNSPAQEQSPALSPDGRYIAFVTERLDGAGERDIYLYDRKTQTLLPTPGLNSPSDEYDPCVVVITGGK